MAKFKLRLWLLLSLIGVLGVLSLLLSTLPVGDLPPEVSARFSPVTLKVLMLLNPAMLLMAMTGLGVWLYDKAGFRAPFFEALLHSPEQKPFNSGAIILHGIGLGILAGALLIALSRFFLPQLPPELNNLQGVDLNVVTKIMYGGVTEELLTRFGLMSLFAWIGYKITKRQSATIYWTANILVALLFAMGHLPIVLKLVAQPTPVVYAYIIAGNSLGGIIFGYAYWKKGLEAAMIAHAVAHLTMIAISTALG